MWRLDGTKLTGFYGTWNGREIELSSPMAELGKLRLVQEGGVSPGPEWKEIHRPNLFAKPDMRYSRYVDQLEVSHVHALEVYGSIDSVNIRLLAESEDGKLAVETDGRAPLHLQDTLARKYDLEYYDDRRTFAFGWVPAEDVHDITVERRDITKD